MKKLFISCICMVLLLGATMQVNAAELKTELQAVKMASETKELENEQGRISKTITAIDKDKGEVTIELKLANTKKEAEVDGTTEIMLVIDNSPSMDFVTANEKTRKEIVIPSTKTLVEAIFSKAQNVKIGLVDFHGHSLFESAGLWNATLRLKLTDNKNSVLQELDKQLERSTESGTNIDAGLQRAEKNFSENCQNKIIILLTDGVPNDDASGNHASNYTTTEEALKVQATTKATLQRLESEGYTIISMMTGMSEDDGNTDKDGTEYTGDTIENELKAVENVFGTQENPTAGKYYLVGTADVDQIINNDILRDVVEKIQNPIKNVKIVDYFPDDIMENFEFSYVDEPSNGTTSETIDKETKTITWNIGDLKGEETATLKYKLKMKDMQNTALLNKVISTNEKVVLTYQDIEDKYYTVTLTTSPSIKLSEVKEVTPPAKNEEKKDNTTAPGNLPQTGFKTTIIVSLIVIGIIAICTYTKSKDYKDIK